MTKMKNNSMCKDFVPREYLEKKDLLKLRSNNEKFEQIQKALDEYLEKKREHF